MTNSRGCLLWNSLKNFDFLSVNSQPLARGPVETYYAQEGKIRTTTNYIFLQSQVLPSVISFIVSEDCSSNLSFHFPLYCCLKPVLQTKSAEGGKSQFLWNKLHHRPHLEKYQESVAIGLRALITDDQNLDSHIKLEKFVESTSEVLKTSSFKTVPQRTAKERCKSYWTPNLSACSREVKHYRKRWIEQGKPRGHGHQSFEDYKEAKRKFRMKQCRAIYEVEIKCFEGLENQHDVDRTTFFRKISRMRKAQGTTSSALEVDG